ncbi:ABC transporter permease [Gudongella sp. DL1XJH-153]|uniref:ABC transporter permease n=1 Tax=Gudongella sp. DL1XJH-153 TaxID=3409804 RepID=UPI003BB72A7C
MNSLIITSLEQGLIFAVLAMGVTITYKILDIADLSVEGTFPLGAFVFAKFAMEGFSPIASSLFAFGYGSIAGLVTALLFVKLKIRPLLAGILTMTMLYSFNLRLNGKANIPLFSYDSLFSDISALVLMVAVVIGIKLLMDAFLKTEIGYLLIATGDNEALVRSLGENSNKYKIIGLMLANGLVALSGSLMAQYQGFVDITMGASIIVVALASIIIGETVSKSSSFLSITTRAIIGAVSYKLIGGIAIDLGMSPTDLRAISAIIVIVFISYNNFSSPFIKSIKKQGGKARVKSKKPLEEL